MKRRACSRVPDIVQRAYVETRRRLLRTPTNPGAGLAGMCIEAVATMYEIMATELGYGGTLAPESLLSVLRRAIDGDEDDGHWTLVYEGVEYDPTIADWRLFKLPKGLTGGLKAPRLSQPGCIYVVRGGDMIDAWPVTDDSSQDYRIVYEIADQAYSP